MPFRRTLTHDVACDKFWDFCAVTLLCFLSSLLFLNWSKFPIFMDTYYHLSVMQGFADAGGWVGRAFWENAPAGRPHLYPPLFHIFELAAARCGLGLIAIARFSQLLIYPFFLVVCGVVVRQLFSSRLAFFVVLLAGASFPLYLSIVILIPFSLAFLLGLASFYYFERQKGLSVLVCLALSFYAHNLMAWLSMAALIGYSFFGRRDFRKMLFIGALSILMALPLTVHQWRYHSYVHVPRALEFYYAHINLLFCCLAVPGAWVCWKRGGRHVFFICLFGSMVLLLFFYRNRFWSGQGLMPFVFLSAVALEGAWQRFFEGPQKSWARIIFWTSTAALFYLFTPTLEFTPFKQVPSFFWGSRSSRPQDDETFMSRVFVSEETFYHPRVVNEIVGLIRAHSGPDDLLYSSFNYAGGMFGVLSHRATTDAMLSEVAGFERRDPIKAARIVLWFKEEDGSAPLELKDVVSGYGLKEIGETDIAFLYFNEQASGKRRVLPAEVPEGVCFGILAILLVLILFDQRNFPCLSGKEKRRDEHQVADRL